MSSFLPEESQKTRQASIQYIDTTVKLCYGSDDRSTDQTSVLDVVLPIAVVFRLQRDEPAAGSPFRVYNPPRGRDENLQPRYRANKDHSLLDQTEEDITDTLASQVIVYKLSQLRPSNPKIQFATVLGVYDASPTYHCARITDIHTEYK
ncbi:hypothetical protein ONS96_008176 [Cadophora gregata f. sp. sojae]|nr:hypothetical protein ONS96_008176 [Cadophora gregata f. sp. sojae]